MMDVAVVFDIESSPPMPLGIYQRTDEDTVIYLSSCGGFAQAPADCVSIVTVDPVAGNAAPECEGHPSGPFDPMGETVYCDGSCRAVSRS